MQEKHSLRLVELFSAKADARPKEKATEVKERFHIKRAKWMSPGLTNSSLVVDIVRFLVLCWKAIQSIYN